MKVQLEGSPPDVDRVRVEAASGPVIVVEEDAGRIVVGVDGVWVWRENRSAPVGAA